MTRATCSFPECGRPVRCVGLCQTHSKQRNRGEVLRPIRRKKPPRTGTQAISGLSLSSDCAAQIEHKAQESNATLNATITDILEEWARSILAGGSEGTG